MTHIGTYNPPKPVDIKEIWAIVHHDGGHLLPPIDDDGAECFMAFPTQDDAMRAMVSQLDKGYIDESCKVVCLKKREYSSRDEDYDNATA